MPVSANPVPGARQLRPRAASAASRPPSTPSSRRPSSWAGSSPTCTPRTARRGLLRTSRAERRLPTAGSSSASPPTAAGASGSSPTSTWPSPRTAFRAWTSGTVGSGASRSRSSIASFFTNGARARGLVGPGADGVAGNADDVLLATGETLAQVQARVLGPSGASTLALHRDPELRGLRPAGGAPLRDAPRGPLRPREPRRRELPRHLLGHGRPRARAVPALCPEVLRRPLLVARGRRSDTDPTVNDLGPLEQRVLELLWRSSGPRTVREVQEGLGGALAYTTVMTTLDRLFKKGLLERRREGQAFSYAPAPEPRGLRGRSAAQGLDRLLGRGSRGAPPGLLRGRGRRARPRPAAGAGAAGAQQGALAARQEEGMSFFLLGFLVVVAVHFAVSLVLSLLAAAGPAPPGARPPPWPGAPAGRAASSPWPSCPPWAGLLAALGVALPAWVRHERAARPSVPARAPRAWPRPGSRLGRSAWGRPSRSPAHDAARSPDGSAPGGTFPGSPCPPPASPATFPLAAVFGMWRPRLLLSDRLLHASRRAARSRAVVEHELAHAGVRDNLRRFLLRASPDPLALLPAGARLRSLFDEASEAAADQRASARFRPCSWPGPSSRPRPWCPPGKGSTWPSRAFHREGGIAARVEGPLRAERAPRPGRRRGDAVPRSRRGSGHRRPGLLLFAGSPGCRPPIHRALEVLVHLLA